MNNYQYEFITTLQYRVKNLQAQVDAFKNGSKYLQMDAQYKSMLLSLRQDQESSVYDSVSKIFDRQKAGRST